jgi:hypothetical protein
MQKTKINAEIQQLLKVGATALILVVGISAISGTVAYAAHQNELTNQAGLKNAAIQGCLEVAQSYKKTLVANEDKKKDTSQYELHEVSFNKDLFNFCVQQKGY